MSKIMGRILKRVVARRCQLSHRVVSRFTRRILKGEGERLDAVDIEIMTTDEGEARRETLLFFS